MKKTIALVLALVLCLSLAACGQQERYPEIADLLDAGDYEGAVMEIYKLYREKNPTEPIETTEPKPTVDRNVESKYRGIVNAANNWNERIANNDRYQWFSAYYYEYETDEDGAISSYHIGFDGTEALAWVYNTALELGDFEKAAEIASRFTLLENKLLELKFTHTDALGNLVEDSAIRYEYNEDGTVSYQSSDSYMPAGMYRTNGTPEETLNDKGQVITITYKSGDGKVNNIINYTYNEDGTVATEEYKSANGDMYNIAYTYDENGKKIQATGVPYNEYGGEQTMTVTYFYDEAGRLVKESGVEDNPSGSRWYNEKVKEYSYDAAGNMILMRTYRLNYDRGEIDWVYEVKRWDYQYDSNNQMTQVTYSYLGTYTAEGEYSSGGNGYVITGTPTYGIFYVYTPGEKIEYNP